MKHQHARRKTERALFIHTHRANFYVCCCVAPTKKTRRKRIIRNETNIHWISTTPIIIIYIQSISIQEYFSTQETTINETTTYLFCLLTWSYLKRTTFPNHNQILFVIPQSPNNSKHTTRLQYYC
jgi:hypothetical protein